MDQDAENAQLPNVRAGDRIMKKIIVTLFVLTLASGAMACPKGTTPVGGTGSHHKGGHCVPKG